MIVLVRALLAAVVLFGLQALLVALVAALRPRRNIYILIVVLAVATMPVVFLTAPLIVGAPVSNDGRVYLALIDVALGGYLFHFMTLPDRSVTLRIFVELFLAPGRSLSLEALSARYGVKTMIESRLRQLEDGHFLSSDAEGTLELQSRGESFGRFVTAGRRLFNIKSAN